MWRSVFALLVTLLHASFEGKSFAGGLDERAVFTPQPVSQVGRWSGIFIGAGGGYGSINNELLFSPGPLSGSSSNVALFNTNAIGGDGGFATLSIGADGQFMNNVVVGAFVDFDFDAMKTTLFNLSSAVPALGLSGANAKFSVDHQLAAGARLGVLSSPSTLWYLSGGFTHLQMSNIVGTATGAFGTASATVVIPSYNGWFVGGGAEAFIYSNLSIKAEYRYSGFEAKALGLPTIGGTNLNNFVTASFVPRTQTVRATLNYKFNFFR